MARTRFAPIVGSLLVAAGLDACVLTAPDPNAPLRQLRAEQAAQVDRVAAAFCTAYYGCGCEETYPIHDTEEDCVEHISEALLGRLEQGINEHLEYDQTCLDANLEMLEAIGCTTPTELDFDLGLQALMRSAERCRTYNGTLQLGEECAHLHSARGDECAPGLLCEQNFSMCAETLVLAEGEPCADSSAPCDAGLVCDWSSEAGTLTCLGPVPLGQSCAVLNYCEPDAWCEPDALTCQALPRAGEPCVTLFGSGICAVGHRCTLGTCEPRGGFGDPCTDGCQLGLVCDEQLLCADERALICDLEASLP